MIMETNWYVVKVLPGKERSLAEQFNKDIFSGRIKNIARFVCPTEKEFVAVKNKKVLREKVLYSGYLYFEASGRLTDDELKGIALIPNIMGMMGDKTPVQLRESDIRRILKDDALETHVDAKRLKYQIGEEVKVIDGPFVSFIGNITEMREDKVIVEIKIFGRNNPVSLNVGQIEKA
jgi:transcriptional antiterminator NusG